MTVFKKRFRILADRFRGRSDSEHEQALVRVVLIAGVFLYFRLVNAVLPIDGGNCAAIGRTLALYEFLSIVYVLWILVSPGGNRARRLLAMATDFGAISLSMFLGGEAATPLYPLYLWVILGNGFRFGLPYLLISAVMGLAGFSLVIASASPWRDHVTLSLGLFFGIVALPAYAASLIRKLTEAKKLAEEANRAKSRFLAIISHELRTPLNAIIGMSDLLFGTRLDDDQLDMSVTIRSSGQALLSLIDSVLDFSRIEAEKTVITVEKTDLYFRLAELEAVFRHQILAKGLSFDVNVGPDVPPLAVLDWPHIRQILINLLANAVKFTDAGHITLRIQNRRSSSGERLLFEVEDTGIGIPEDKRAVIFEAFEQAEDTMNRRFEGSGLGLAISRQLAALMGGELCVESRLGQGSRFSFDIPLTTIFALPTLPVPLLVIAFCRDRSVTSRLTPLVEGLRLAATMDDALAFLAETNFRKPAALLLDDLENSDAKKLATMAQSAGVPILAVGQMGIRGIPAVLTAIAADESVGRMINALLACRAFAGRGVALGGEPALSKVTPRHILVAEDNRVNVKVVCKILEKAGHRVDVVMDGDALLDALTEGSFDVVVADVNMPGMPLTEVVKLHRMASSHLQAVPIVALSADATVETRRECEMAGIDGYLTKPVMAALLLSTIDSLTRREACGGPTTADNVADLSKHPAFVAAPRISIDWSTIDALVALGDHQLVCELARDFVDDAAQLICAMEGAVACGDFRRFRADCHALRSCAANVGARGITRLCQEGAVKAERFAEDGPQFCVRVQTELSLFKEEMARYLDQSAPSLQRL
jgi:two-component system sensor histidine kinase RpfC